MSNDDLTKLELYNLKLYGREAELSTLLDAYRRVTRTPRREGTADDVVDDNGNNDKSDDGSSQMVVVAGYSGTGKSALVQKFRENLVEEGSQAFFASGKFDPLSVDTPYSGFVQAITELCEQILSRDAPEMRRAIKDAVGEEGRALTRLVPKLKDVIGGESDEIQSIGSMEAQNRFNSMFRDVVRAVCGPDHPVVFFLDDIQWADVASMDLIKALLTDEKSKNLLFISSVRDNEFNATKDVKSCFAKMESKEMDKRLHHGQYCMWKVHKKKAVPMTKIHLGNLDPKTVNQLLSDVLRMDETKTQPLADVLYRKTQGNIFFLLRFLEMLQDEDLLTFSFATLKWTWDIEGILSKTSISDNVLDLELAKLRKLSFESQMVLLMAACIGSQFDSRLLKLFMGACREAGALAGYSREKVDSLSIDVTCQSSVEEKVGGLLELLVNEGLLDKGIGTRYKFAHDRIHEASYALVPEGRQRDLVHLRVGVLLWTHRDSFPDDEDYLLYIAANQLNRGSYHITEEGKRVELAKLNLDIAERAMGSAAFLTAALYLRAAINLLGGEDQWEKHHDLCLKLHTLLAEMAYCTHSFDECEKMVQAVTKHGRSCREKIPVNFTLISLRIAQERFEDALALGLAMLSKSGENIPRKTRLPFVVKDLIDTRMMAKKRSDNELLMLPEMKDEEKLVAMRVLVSLIPCVLYLKEMDQLSIMACRTVRLSLRYGVSKYSAFGYACFGMVVCGFNGNVDEGYRFDSLSLSLMERFGAMEWKARVYYMVYSAIHHWKHPVQDCLEPLLQAYESGMKSGDITDAMMSAKTYSAYYVFSGLPLGPVEDDIRSFCNEMKEYGQTAALHATLPMWQYMLNMMGHSDDPLQLTGEAMNQEQMTNDALEKKNGLAVALVKFMRIQLAYTFGDLESAAALADDVRDDNVFQMFASHFAICKITFLVGLISIGMAKKTRRRKWRVKARRSIATVEKWAKNAAGNCLHMLMLLKAEYKSLTGKKDEVKKAYDRAIATASRSGFTQDQALANERAGDFFVGAGDVYWASHYLCRAHELYSEWGAQAKADHLLRTRGSLFTPSQGVSSMSAARGRSRFKSVHKSSDDSTFSSSGGSSGFFSTSSRSSSGTDGISTDGSFENNMVY